MVKKITDASVGGVILEALAIKCPKCTSKQVLYKKTTKTTWCRRCGAEWKQK